MTPTPRPLEPSDEGRLSRTLEPGTQLHSRGKTVTLGIRKAGNDGWWLTDNQGGLADYVIDSGFPEWHVVGQVEVKKCPTCWMGVVRAR